MGRYSYSSKSEADSLKSVSVYWLNKYKYLEPGYTKSGGIVWTRSNGSKNDIRICVSIPDLYVQFKYIQTDRETGEKKDFDYKIPLITSVCHFGGIRYWFKCSMYKSGKFCGRRVATVYKDGDYFACRHCYDLTYSSKKENYKGFFGMLTKLIYEEKRMEAIRDSLKRKTYAGRPTKKVRRFLRLASHHPEKVHELIDQNIYRAR
ncbi:hypothetical protein A3K29_00815 [Candidatus Collierbacteria bacterium RIFOXYB2_FULL_46_14]|uniref:Uncharacterized protein n=1 Tax=Candidatus Collierbacteria bacterium GW2011_GWA2_46_26 TaxID=1618381 RepID=A0A0G1RTH1_9BACT|nr:MAG: hypothetical protein UW29_C0008G0060 [Candidatus Collierbacteria bacterium GW2011_GWC2_44_13]KKU33258.1 MAG: hypothetical protein UX47_C0005G0060 [Candidatus Collierbacteria bacterium GW2011_GWA2_46_26]OGD72679.1 MAG: hypothetical protein A3K29_00815 [Candidatus Collierbacteria bacterium RIFOXYB2_FULL_46_14]OGD75721.1 MAG: hypothetical protein A3K43_00815 [Candidatus Collierbacteria bacterium RIFOXYA2_FULL_46_20]OGD77057.1 MAG: hypothetical protein A3K39_00815 [Candidatus Collierbacteri